MPDAREANEAESPQTHGKLHCPQKSMGIPYGWLDENRESAWSEPMQPAIKAQIVTRRLLRLKITG